MALINCPQCGHMISDKAKACPKCGYVLNNEQAKPVENIDDEESESQFDVCTPQQGGGLKWILIVLAILVIGGGVGYYFYADNKAKKEIALAAEQARLDSIEAARLDSIEAARLDSIRQDSIARRNFTTPDLAIKELHGHVAKCEWLYGDGAQQTTLSYNYDGKLISTECEGESYTYTRDKNGQIINEIKTTYSLGNIVYKYKWKDNKISVKQSVSTTYPDCPIGYSDYYFYNSDNLLAYETSDDSVFEGGGQIRNFKTVYSDYKFDEMGNWISRKAKTTYQMSWEGDETWENHTGKTTEVRVITYYDSNIGKDSQ